MWDQTTQITHETKAAGGWGHISVIERKQPPTTEAWSTHQPPQRGPAALRSKRTLSLLLFTQQSAWNSNKV